MHGLERMQKALLALGNPQHTFKSIHIAGTNGKGSVSWKIAEGLKHEGKRIGLYTSPHIGTFRERIQIDDQKIQEDEFVQWFPVVFEVARGCTFFEMTTLLAFLYFSEKKVDAAVIETGVGGRLDATNIIRPMLSVITSVSLDHVGWLGSTRELIAVEKAGIIKSDIPVVIGQTVPKVVDEIAFRLNAPLTRVSGSFNTFDEENSLIAKTALGAIQVSPDSIVKGIKRRPPCRMEIIEGRNYPLIFDVAHNPGGFAALFLSLKNLQGWQRFRVILGMGQDKDHKSCLKELIPYAEEIFLIQAGGVREGIDAAKLQADLYSLDYDHRNIYRESSIQTSVKSALLRSDEDRLPVLVIGTFYIMAAVKSAAGIFVEQDF